MVRAQRNCNPLNIRRVAGARWRGQSVLQTDREFVRFDAMEWGIRAAFCILHTYARRYNAFCIRDIIRRWAPPSENNTEQYIRNVCCWTGFGGNQRLAEHEWPALVRAMARQESGLQLSMQTVMRAFCLYKNY
ncbi:MAG: hypothetical protein J6W03_09185 [Bacteroidaceae bacterium]|nr:hypothetical protein [Bacteroidaceae bacterium]